MPPANTATRKNDLKQRVKRALALIGPGVVTGAADDDPSGIFTCSQSGAQFGLTQLWTIFFILPLLIAVQEMCARIAIVTGEGLTAVIKQHYSKTWLYSIVLLLVIANTINLGVDLGAMAEAARLLAPVPYVWAVVVFGAVAVLLQIFVPYRRYAPLLKVLCISLFTYFATSIIATRSWAAVARATFLPQLHFNFQYMVLIVGLLGTTVSPYMFFWQAAQEREEQMLLRDKPPAFIRLRNMRIDTIYGMLFSQVASWCIMLTTAEVLNVHGVTDIRSAAQAASALAPLLHTFHNAGKIAEVLFALGILGTGALAVPIFAATSSYAFCELLDWKGSLEMHYTKARGFYVVIAIGTVVGMLINFIGLDPIKALVYTAVLNGVVAVPMIFLLIRVTANPKIMGRNTSGALGSVLSWTTFAGMGGAAVIAIYEFFTGR